MKKMIPLENFETDLLFQKVIAKAREVKPWVRKLHEGIYRVMNRKKRTGKQEHGKYIVSFDSDADDQPFGHCTCPAGDPPLDTNGIPKWEPKACYHLAAAYFHHHSLASRAEARRRKALARRIFGAARAA
jgi:hypothetical protein